MHKITIMAAGLLLALAPAAYAQQRGQQQQDTAPKTRQAPTIKNVNIIDMQELSETDQSQVNAVASKTSKEDLQTLRSSIDRDPTVSQALQAKGLSSASVIAVSMDTQGTLTLITKKSS